MFKRISFYRGNTVSSTYSDYVFVALVTKHEMRMRHYIVPALIRRCDDRPTTITHVPVAAVPVLNTPDDGRLLPKHVRVTLQK